MRFSNALLRRKLLNAEYTELVTTATMSRMASAGSATAVELLENGDLKIYPGSEYVIAALSNLDPPAAGRISNYIAERLPI